MPEPGCPDGARTASVEAAAPGHPLPRVTLVPPPRLADFARRIAVAVLVSLLILGLAYALWRESHVLLEVFAGVLLAIFLSTVSDWVHRRIGIGYGWSLLLTVIVLTALAGGAGYLLGNHLAAQFADMYRKLPEAFVQIRDYLEERPWGRTLLGRVPPAAQSLTEGGQLLSVTGLISDVFGFVVGAVIILFVGIFGAAEPGVYKAGLLHLVPPPNRPRAQEALDTLLYNLRWWLVGQVCLMVIIGATTTLGLWAIGIPLALTLGIIAGIFELVPYAGPWLSAVPAALIALLVSPGHLLATIGLYLGLHLLEGYVLLPIIQRRAVMLPPALTLVMQVLLGDLLGFLGLFVAAPLTVTLVVLLKMLYVEDTLGDQAVNVPGEPGNEEKKQSQPAPASG